MATVKVGQPSNFSSSTLQLNMKRLLPLTETTLLAIIYSYPIQYPNGLLTITVKTAIQHGAAAYYQSAYNIFLAAK